MQCKNLMFLIFQLSLALFSAELTTKDILPVLTELMSDHVSQPKLTPALFRKAMEAYIQHWDPERLLLMKEEVPQVLNDFEKIRTSNWTDYSPLLKFHAFLINRRRYVEDFAAKQLGDHYQLNLTAQLETNPKLTRFPSLDEVENRIREHIHFDVARGLSLGLNLDDAKGATRRKLSSQTQKMKTFKNEDILETFINSFATVLDPHSYYLSAEAYREHENQRGLALEGIGITLKVHDGKVEILDLYKGGGAEQGGILRPKDLIIGVKGGDGKIISTAGLNKEETVKLIRGRAGTKVGLLIQRTGEKIEVFDTEVERKKFELKSSRASIQYKELDVDGVKRKIAIIKIPSFYESSDPETPVLTNDMLRLLKEAKAQNIEGLILDLIDNPGGGVTQAINTAGLFVGDKPALTVKTGGGHQTHRSKSNELVYEGPLVVLTSPASASASEILAGILQAYGRALVVGSEQTFGKGTMQKVKPLRGVSGSLKITEGMFFLPNGKTTQYRGVPSDIILSNLHPNDRNLGEAHLDHALAPQTMDSFSPRNHSPLPDLHSSAALVTRLATLSKQRVGESSYFQELRAKAFAEENRPSRMTVTEFLNSRATQKIAEGTANDSEAKLSPWIGEAVDVLSDWIRPLPQEQCLGAWRKIGL